MFGDGPFSAAVKVKRGHERGLPIHELVSSREVDTAEMRMQRAESKGRHRESGRLQATDSGLGRIQPRPRLQLRLLPSRTERKQPVFKPPVATAHMAALSPPNRGCLGSCMCTRLPRTFSCVAGSVTHGTSPPGCRADWAPRPAWRRAPRCSL